MKTGHAWGRRRSGGLYRDSLPPRRLLAASDRPARRAAHPTQTLLALQNSLIPSPASSRP